MQLCEILLVEHPEKFYKTAGPLHKTILFCTTNASTPIRRKCLVILRRIVGSLSGATIARALFKELLKLLESNKIQIKPDKEENKENDNTVYMSSHSLVECVTALCSSTGLTPENVQLIAIDSLLPIHHPLITKLDPDLWIKVVRHFGCKPQALVAQRAEYFRKVLVDEFRNTPVSILKFAHVNYF